MGNMPLPVRPGKRRQVDAIRPVITASKALDGMHAAEVLYRPRLPARGRDDASLPFKLAFDGIKVATEPLLRLGPPGTALGVVASLPAEPHGRLVTSPQNPTLSHGDLLRDPHTK